MPRPSRVIRVFNVRPAISASLALKLPEKLVYPDEVSEALKAMALKIELMVLALPQQGLLDLLDREAVVLLMDLCLFGGFVVVFLSFIVNHVLD